MLTNHHEGQPGLAEKTHKPVRKLDRRRRRPGAVPLGDSMREDASPDEALVPQEAAREDVGATVEDELTFSGGACASDEDEPTFSGDVRATDEARPASSARAQRTKRRELTPDRAIREVRRRPLSSTAGHSAELGRRSTLLKPESVPSGARLTLTNDVDAPLRGRPSPSRGAEGRENPGKGGFVGRIRRMFAH